MKGTWKLLTAGLAAVAILACPAWAGSDTGEVACCLPDDQCVNINEQECLDSGGSVVAACLGDSNSDGADDACKPDELEGCCLDDGSCVMFPFGECNGVGTTVPICLGDANGNQIDDACEPQGEEGCCLPDGQCTWLTAQQCERYGGVVVTACLGDSNGNNIDDACESQDEKGCCLEDGQCIWLVADECISSGGVVVTQCLGDANGNNIDDACETVEEEACCFDDGSCGLVPVGECSGTVVATCLGDANGNNIDDACEDPLEESCCLPNGQCSLLPLGQCARLGGYVVPMCLGDANGNNVDDACESADEEACCFDDGSCGLVPVGQCSGTVVAACLGDANGNNIDDACEDPQEEGCCLQDGTCTWVMAEECIDMGGYVVPACLGDADGNGVDDACEEPTEYILNFSIDIGSDTELSDPFWDNDEVFDPGDIYTWSQNPLPVGGADGDFFDDMATFTGFDPWPDTPDYAVPPMTRVPVGTATSPWEEMYHEFFDLDGHDNIELDLREIIPGYPMMEPYYVGDSNCIHLGKHTFISFDDDMAPGWILAPMGDVPVTVPSPAGMIYGTSARNDEVIGLTVQASGGPPAYPLINRYPIASETMVHISMGPNPDDGEEEDDDVDSLDILDRDFCQYLYFSADHEATFYDVNGMPLDPGDIYMATSAGPIRIIDERTHLGVPEDTDIDAFEFVRVEIDTGIPTALGILFSVDEDDPITPMDESGGLMPNMIYVSLLNGQFNPYLQEPLEDDIDAIMCWRDKLPPAQMDDYDWGDAPDGPYPTLAANAGANHLIVPNVFLGSLIDGELNGQPSPLADGDDLTNLPDEDGVTFAGLIQGRNATITVTASTAGYFNLWIDKNHNGSWGEATDWVLADIPIPAGTSTHTVPIGFHDPHGYTFARARFCTQPGLSYTGSAPDGEVEDYRINIRPWWTIHVDVLTAISLAYHGPTEGYMGIQIYPPLMVYGAPYDCEPRFRLPQYELNLQLSGFIPDASGITVVAQDTDGNVHNATVTLDAAGTSLTAIFTGTEILANQRIYQVTVSGTGVNTLTFRYVVLVGNVVNGGGIMDQVNIFDKSILISRIGMTSSAAGAAYDIVNNPMSWGKIDAFDKSVMIANLGKSAH